MIECIIVFKLFCIAVQVCYWYIFHDEKREDRVWAACVHPGNNQTERDRRTSEALANLARYKAAR